MYDLHDSDPERCIVERNIDYSCQFVYHELWWYEHAREKESSDSQRIKARESAVRNVQLKKQFMSTVLFPSLQMISGDVRRIGMGRKSGSFLQKSVSTSWKATISPWFR